MPGPRFLAPPENSLSADRRAATLEFRQQVIGATSPEWLRQQLTAVRKEVAAQPDNARASIMAAQMRLRLVDIYDPESLKRFSMEQVQQRAQQRRQRALREAAADMRSRGMFVNAPMSSEDAAAWMTLSPEEKDRAAADWHCPPRPETAAIPMPYGDERDLALRSEAEGGDLFAFFVIALALVGCVAVVDRAIRFLGWL